MIINTFRGNYYFLSNFFEAPVFYNNVLYQNNEAAFQAQKCKTDTERIAFANVSPKDAKRMGRNVSLRPDWEQVKEQIMYEIVSAKFHQNPILGKQLKATGDAILEEGNNWGDRIWGTVNGVGQNKLGKILMRVRQEL